MLTRRVYIAGRMTGLPDFNFPAFHAAAAKWREKGWEVENPAEAFNGAQNLAYKAYVERDIMKLQQCDAIFMLRGWDDAEARGSVWEYAIARHLLGMEVFYEDGRNEH